MPAPESLRRTAPGVLARAASAVVTAVLITSGSTACTGPGEPSEHVSSTAGTRASVSSSAGDGTASGPPTSSTASGLASLRDGPPLVAASAVVPQQAAVVSFTDLDRVKRRLGYPDLTSGSSTSERFAFWERARADGAMFTGTRLYDVSSEMALDYGWTGEDVSWEVDFALTETGCLRSMICDTAHGYVLGLRPDLDWSVVTDSLRRNGFEPDNRDPATFTSDAPTAPFPIIHLIPELHAVAGGNAIGVQRLSEAAAGAPAFSGRIAAVYYRLGDVESLHAATGCVDLAAALGPDANSADVTAFLRHHNVTELAVPASTVVAVADRRHATIEVETAEAAGADDLALRTAAIRSWPGLQTGIPFEQIADVTGELNGNYESFALDVAAMPELRAMTLTDEAPWALCPYAENR